MIVYWFSNFEGAKHQLVKLQYVLAVKDPLMNRPCIIQCVNVEFHFINFVWHNIATILKSLHFTHAKILVWKTEEETYY